MIFISVDLPAPFSPTRPWISPSASAKSTSRNACTPPKDLEMPARSRSGGGVSESGGVITVADARQQVLAEGGVLPRPRGGGRRSRLDQEMIFHPLHAGRIVLG